MENSTCFACHQQGHWAMNCPFKSSDARPFNKGSNCAQNIWCRCGHGRCEVKTSNSVKNPGRMYYTCPIKRGVRCKDFVKWCDDPVDESDLQPPLFKYPECECGAGVCRRVKATQNLHAVKYCFTCPVKQV
ncbi:Calcium-binding mitochondrial carrier protein SCaMC-1-A [Spatholobus suberectus]|nr:Calcium-binding mitochondrial carrier protein SCaMC-1-A [Spatholobus suberectus]